MTASEPKVGDRVLCGHGEAKLVGVVRDVLLGRQRRAAGWIVEVLHPPVPDVVGALVRDHEGDPWVRDKDGWWCRSSGPWTLADLVTARGPLTVLYAPAPS